MASDSLRDGEQPGLVGNDGWGTSFHASHTLCLSYWQNGFFAHSIKDKQRRLMFIGEEIDNTWIKWCDKCHRRVIFCRSGIRPELSELAFCINIQLCLWWNLPFVSIESLLSLIERCWENMQRVLMRNEYSRRGNRFTSTGPYPPLSYEIFHNGRV